MNQQKTGGFLKRLRKEKGLTQEQLAEQFYVSPRTVSRWETGSNLPDVGTLIELADFYEVDIREIINGERKGEIMDHETKDTLKKVANYALEQERGFQFRAMAIALATALALLVCTSLFLWETKGFLYGIVPEEVCQIILTIVYGLAGCLLVFYLRIRWTLAKPTPEPEEAVAATVISREVKPGTGGAGRSMMGYSFLIRFQTQEGEPLELYAYETEYGSLKEGMTGILTHQGRYFVSFQEKA